MRALILRGTIMCSLAFVGACASTSTSTVVGPQAFPRSRPVPNAPVETEPIAASESPMAPRALPRTAGAPAAAVALPPTSASSSAALLQTALSLLGTPYRFGGVSPDTGFDCSGFVGYVMRQHGVEIPRTVVEQFTAGESVAQDDVQAGDLVFFTTTGPGATHVGMVVTTGSRWEFVHAPADGSRVRIERFDTGYWQLRWIGARRVF